MNKNYKKQQRRISHKCFIELIFKYKEKKSNIDKRYYDIK
jgi:hypothetical protein